MTVQDVPDADVIDAIVRLVCDDARAPAVIQKRQVYRWTDQMSRKFDFVAALLGIASTTPTEIIFFLNDEALTRSIVSSHLQKTREKLMRRLKKNWLSNADCGGWLADFWREPGFHGFSDEQIRYFVNQMN